MSEILIVDDDPDLLSVLVSLLELSGHTVKSADGYEEALEVIETKKPQLAVLDYHLAARGQGLGMLEMIRSKPALAGTKVIMVSGLDAEDECRSKEADGFLQKPFELDDLLAEMTRLGEESEGLNG